MGIAYQVLMGSSARLPDGDSVNTRVAAFAALAPHRVQAWAGLNLSDPPAALGEPERCHALGTRGVTVIAGRHLDLRTVAGHEVADLGLGDAVTHDWLRGNAARLLGLDDNEPHASGAAS